MQVRQESGDVVAKKAKIETAISTPTSVHALDPFYVKLICTIRMFLLVPINNRWKMAKFKKLLSRLLKRRIVQLLLQQQLQRSRRNERKSVQSMSITIVNWAIVVLIITIWMYVPQVCRKPCCKRSSRQFHVEHLLQRVYVNVVKRVNFSMIQN
jgi:hypothetical protein